MPKGTSQGTRREKSQKGLKWVVGLIVKSIDNFIAEGSGNEKLRRTLGTLRPGLVKRCLEYDKVMSKIEDDELGISIHTESIALISLAFSAGAMLGGRNMAQHIMSQIRNGLKENTSSARRVALNNKSPILNQKTKVTIDAARSYMADHPNEKRLTPNALMNQIYSDVEKQCRLNNIPSPSRSSVWTYLSKANLL
jgi:hypothetical protein